MKRAYLLFIIVAICFQPLVWGQSNSKIKIITPRTEVEDVDIVSTFEAFQSPIYSDPGLPALILVSKNKTIAAGIGGNVRLTSSLDFSGIVNDIDFIPFKIPLSSTNPQKSRFIMDVTTSRLFLRIFKKSRFGLIHFYIDTDFRVSTGQFRFNHIYASLNGLRIGRYWSVMADLKSYPPSADFQGPNAFTGLSAYQVSYNQSLCSKFSYGVGLEVPDYSIDESIAESRAPQVIPTIPLYFQYQGGWGHVRLSGLVRWLSYRNVIIDKERKAFTWGGILSSYLQPFSRVSFYQQAVYGKGIGNYTFDLSGAGLDLVPSASIEGKLVPLGLWGGFLGTKYVCTSKLSFSATYSYLKLLRHTEPNSSYYKYGQYWIATMYYKIDNNLQVAFEYNNGKLKLQDNDKGHANRLMAMIRYDF